MSKYDDPRCNHAGTVHRVTNLPDGTPLTPDMAHRSAWVCEKRPCVLDAMAWVERGTDQPAIVYDRDKKVVAL